MNDDGILENTLASQELGNIGSSTHHGTASDSSSGSDWATTISQYLLERRKQTYLAYQSQLKVNDRENKSDTQDWLFEALFERLVQRLEEGHTVVTLSCTSQSDQTWQRELIQPLFQPLLDYASAILAQSVDIQSLIKDTHALWKTVMLQSTLSQHEKRRLEHRYAVAIELYQYLQLESNKNSLSDFVESLVRHPLMEEKIDEVEEDKVSPIVFQTTGYKGNEHSSETLTLTLWLHRTWQAEYNLANHIMRIKNQNVKALPITANEQLNPEQQEAIYMANQSAFSIITGGPGTGKTFTVAQLVMALYHAQSVRRVEDVGSTTSTSVNLALAAPTGKAAQRMQESLQDAIEQAGVAMQLPEAKTIHRLLGIGQGGQPRYHKDNSLSEDIIIVDEASMLGVELANYLVSAIKPNARLILLGDANQLAAVDAGAVLADLCRIPALQAVHQRLESSRRFTADSGIGKLAKLINHDDNTKASMASIWTLIDEDKTLDFYHLNQRADSKNVINRDIINSLSNYKFYDRLVENCDSYVSQAIRMLSKVEEAKSVPTQDQIDFFDELMITLNKFRILTAGHHGRCGDHAINQYISEQHRQQLKLPLSKSSWYHGRPIMVLQNNYELGLFNGDIGICLQTERGRLQVFFENKKQGISINMLSDEMVATAYAMTIHKSQGSEFEHVAICFDDSNARLLSQELIYTAVTRAKKQVSIFSTQSAFTQALVTPTIRQTGLSLQFDALHETSE